MKKRLTSTRPKLSAILLLLASSVPSIGDPIAVPNFSFEERDTFDPFTNGTDKYNQWGRETWRHWQRTANGGPLRIWNPGEPGFDDTGQGAIDVGFGGEAPEGDYVVLVRSRYSDGANTDGDNTFEAAVQILAEPFDPNTAYTLTAKVGRPPGSANYSPDWHGYAVQLAVGGADGDGATYAGRVDGGTVIAQDVDSIPVAADEFVTSIVVYRPDPAFIDLAGQPMQIRLCALEDPDNFAATTWAAFDEVTLETGAVELPSFDIVDFRYSADDARLILTWDSREGEFYSVRYSTDLTNWDGDLDDGVEADAGETTTRSFNLAPIGLGTAERIYFRVQRER